MGRVSLCYRIASRSSRASPVPARGPGGVADVSAREGSAGRLGQGARAGRHGWREPQIYLSSSSVNYNRAPLSTGEVVVCSPEKGGLLWSRDLPDLGPTSAVCLENDVAIPVCGLEKTELSC